MITKPLNCLSLCDGLSVAQIAMHKAGIPYRRYVASEIDKYAITATQKNYPATLQIGDINKINVDKLPFKIDLVLSGTPCTGFSIAGKLGEFTVATGQMFFQFCRILAKVKKYNPDVKFLFENVASMRPHVKEIITTMLGVEPIRINSALVCAQNRNRLYWTNIKYVQQPEDRGIVLQDILEYDVDIKYNLSKTVLARINKDAVLKQLAVLKLAREKSYAITTATHRQTELDFLLRGKGQLEQVAPSVIQCNPAQEFGNQPRQQNRIYDSEGKSPTLTNSKAYKCNIVAKVNSSQDGKDFAITGKSQCLSAGNNNVPKVAVVNEVAVITHNMMPRSSTSGKGGTGQVTRTDGKSYCLDTGNTNAVQVVQLGVVNDNGTLRSTIKSNCIDANYHKGMDNHAPLSMVIHRSGKIKTNQTKAACFTAGAHSGGNHSDMDVLEQAHQPIEEELVIRRLTPIEVCRLQDIPDDYFYDDNGKLIISESQVYKSVGNAWQAETIAHILSYLHNE